MRLNGVTYERYVEPRRLLADFIRHDVGLTGTHVGCEHGVCGACTVILDGQLVKSCLMLAIQARGADVMTVEGLATDGTLHPIQQAFVEKNGFQCGFCTPGFILMTKELLAHCPHPTTDEIRHYLSGNLCRCASYLDIVEAVKMAAEAGGSTDRG